MFASEREIELRVRKNHLFAQYLELVWLRAEIARLLNPLKISPPRKRRNRSVALHVQRNGRSASILHARR